MAAPAQAGPGHAWQAQTQLSKSLERILEEAHLSGELKLSGRKLKEFPRTGGKHDLTDTVIADLSKNKFWELPPPVLEFLFVEKLHLYHNALRCLPEAVGCLQALTFLDLSRNQLQALPDALCHLHSLQVLLVANNKLSCLPDDMGKLESLLELDGSCNEMTRLPRSLARLKNLKALHLRSNLLTELPIELTYLRLTWLDMSENRVSTLPVELRLMCSLERLRLGGNPLVAPPAALVARGKVHIFKFLETQAQAHERRRAQPSQPSTRRTLLPDLRAKRHTVDSGYSTSDGLDAKWAQDGLTEEVVLKSSGTDGGEASLSRSTLALDQLEAKRLIELQSRDRTHTTTTTPTTPASQHVQTYREYKEALRQQRAAQPQDVYRPVQKVPPNYRNGDTDASATATSHRNGDTNAPNHRNGDPHLAPADYVKPVSPNTPRPSQPSPRPCKWTADLPPDKLSFTMRREFERAKEEAELMGQLRHNIESRLRMALPDELGPALMDGVVLCHLANHVRPRSVASIHVPSPAVPKLSMARCRRNVDNFLEACRKIGVEEGELCSVEDVVASLDVAAVLHTVHSLTHPRPALRPAPPPASGPSSATLICVLIGTCVLLYLLPHEQ